MTIIAPSADVDGCAVLKASLDRWKGYVRTGSYEGPCSLTGEINGVQVGTGVGKMDDMTTSSEAVPAIFFHI